MRWRQRRGRNGPAAGRGVAERGRERIGAGRVKAMAGTETRDRVRVRDRNRERSGRQQGEMCLDVSLFCYDFVSVAAEGF